VENAPDRIMNVPRDGTITFVNHPTEAGEGAATPTNVFQLIQESERLTLRTALDRVFDRAEPVSCEVQALGEDRWYSARLGPIEKGGAIAASTLILTDITDRRRGEVERRRLEAQLREAQKLEALGKLSGGIAHDFNNLLTVIAGNTSLLESHVTGESARETLNEIRTAEERAASLTRQLLAFGRRQVMQPRVLDLNTSIAGIEGMLRRLIGEHIEFEFTPSGGAARVKADQGQLEQVLVNLVLNARDAMQEGGRLEVRTWRHCSDGPVDVGGVTIQPGRHAVLSITDDGVGMAEQTKAQMFEPFFTTKPSGKGSGLGLSSVLGIVQQSGGQIAVESGPSCGTAISIYLPEVDEPIDPLPGAAAQNEVERCAGHILVVEDEKAVRRVLERLLTGQGYTVDLAEDGMQALEIARQCGNGIDLLLTDLVMPGMSGRTLADRLHEICGPVPVLYMSGYADDTLGDQRILHDSMRFIQKPFTSDQLTRELRQVLEP
jgi:signal transduction histidine kinase/ActR/RegA family two-component response regulator